MTAQRMGDGSVKAAAWVMKEESYPADMMAAYGGDESVLKSKILEDFQDWAPEMRKWIEVGARFRPWPLYELPIGEFWEHKRGFSLVGDAASLMTPFAGEGVNKAMKDALELAEAIEGALKGEANGDVDEAVRKYEQDMFPRATKYQQRTMQNKQAMFRKNGAVDFMVTMVDVVAQELGYDLNRGWLAWVPFRTTMWCWARFWQALGQGNTMARRILSR
jgi:2-polyprenyl-6-methoxyphenol hydroxylase-like FAD-dependent oxidoreductase